MKQNNFKIWKSFIRTCLLLAFLVICASASASGTPPPRSIAFMFRPLQIFSVTKDMSVATRDQNGNPVTTYENGNGTMFKYADTTPPVDENSGTVDDTVYVTLTFGNRSNRDKPIYIRDTEPQNFGRNGDWVFTSPKVVQYSGFGGNYNESQWKKIPGQDRFYNDDAFVVPANGVAKLKYIIRCRSCSTEIATDRLLYSTVEVGYDSKEGPFWLSDIGYVHQPGTESKLNNLDYYNRFFSALDSVSLSGDAQYFINTLGYVFRPDSRSAIQMLEASVEVQLEGDSGSFVSDIGYILTTPGSVIIGDIFGANKIPSGLEIAGKQSGFSGGSVDSDIYYRFPGYEINRNSVIGWNPSNSYANAYMNANITELEKVAKVLPPCLKVGSVYELSTARLTSSCSAPTPSSQFTLNNSVVSSIDPWYNPSGVWSAPPDTTVILDDITFAGTGTIITNGTITINNPVREVDSKKPVGFIVKLGDVNVADKAIDPIRGAYFVPNGTFDLSKDSKYGLNMTGSFVAKNFQLRKSDEAAIVRIEYDQNLVDNPPPGFSLLTQVLWTIGK